MYVCMYGYIHGYNVLTSGLYGIIPSQWSKWPSHSFFGVEIPRVGHHSVIHSQQFGVEKSAPPYPPWFLKVSARVFGTSKCLRYAHVSQGVCILWYILYIDIYYKVYPMIYTIYIYIHLYTSIYIYIPIPRKCDRTRYDLTARTFGPRRRSPKDSPPHPRCHSDLPHCRESALKPPGNSLVNSLKMMLKLYSKMDFT